MAQRSTFRSTAILSGLVTADQIERAVAACREPPKGEPPPPVLVEVDDTTLAAKLVEQRILTPYQAEQIKAGRTKLNLGPYTITEFIGQGGMGQVFKGVHQVMGRECAVKVLPIHKSTPESISNFTREIRTQAQLDHPNLVRAYDAGRDGNVHYLITEFVAGTDLRRLVRSQGPLTTQQASSVILQAARALEHAHSRGLIHRDVKPGNILVTPEGKAKVSDLGLAGFVHEADTDPRAGKIVGTPDYLAPEQIRTPNDVTKLCDVYSLGCTLYYAVCGKVPFPGGTARDKARRHCEETPWHPRRFNPDLQEEYVEIIADMMEKDPTKRINTTEVIARLEQWAGDAAPLKPPAATQSPWTTAASYPSVNPDDYRADLPQDTDAGEYSASDQISQASQGTAGLAAANYETAPLKPGIPRVFPVALPLPPQTPPTTLVLMTLLVAVPLSMAAGALLASLLFLAFR